MKFKIGDRVAVYGFRPTEIGTACSGRIVYSRKDRGTVSTITADDELVVDFDGGTVAEVHPKQCRLLKKKPLRRIWVPKRGQFLRMNIEKSADELLDYLEVVPATRRWFTEFVEVRRPAPRSKK